MPKNYGAPSAPKPALYSRCEKEKLCVCIMQPETEADPLVVDNAAILAAVAAQTEDWDNGDPVDPTADFSQIIDAKFTAGKCGWKCLGVEVTVDNESVEHFPAGSANPSAGMFSGGGGGEFGGGSGTYDDPIDTNDEFSVKPGGAVFIDLELMRCYDLEGNPVDPAAK